MVAGGAGPAGPVMSSTTRAGPVRAIRRRRFQSMMGLGSGTPGRSRGTRTRRAAGGSWQRTGVSSSQRLPVNPDWDLGGVGVDDHLPPGQADEPLERLPQQAGRLGGALDRDGEHPQGAAVQPGPAPEPGDVAHPILVVGDQDRLGPLHGHVLGPGHQPRPALADEQIGGISVVVRRLSSR